MLRRRSRPLLVAAVLLLVGARRAPAADAIAAPDAAEHALVAAARAAAEAQCDCGAAQTHGAYLRCVSQTVKSLATGRLSRGGMHEAMECAARSTCGRTGMATCCKTNRHGRMRCGVVHAGKCAAPAGGSACVSSFSSACDAVEHGCAPLDTPPHDINCCLPVAGAPFDCEPQKPSECATEGGIDMGGDGACEPDPCVGVTTTTVTTSTTLPHRCGNGIVEPGEQCDPPWSRTCAPRGPGHVNRECQDDCTCPDGVTTSTLTTTTTSSTGPSTTVGTTSTSTSTVGTTSSTSTSLPVGTTTSTVVTTTTVTTTTSPSLCGCGTPDPRFFSFKTGVGTGPCGQILDDSGASLLPLEGNLLYIGGGGGGVPPNLNPDNGLSVFKVTSCTSKTLQLTSATSADTGGSNLDCTSDGCFFGAPLPIPMPANPSLSNCVINTISGSASGTARCDTGAANVDFQLASATYLTGDVLLRRCTATTDPNNVGRNCSTDADCPGGTCADDSAAVQPCPICNPTTLLCNGGPKDGQACTPGTIATISDAFPTSHDCDPPSAGGPLAILPIAFALTTGTSSATSANLSNQAFVFCGFCSAKFAPTFRMPLVPCTSDAQCSGLTGCPGRTACNACRQRNPGAFGEGPVRTITETGAPAGPLATGQSPAPVSFGSVFCIPPTFNTAVDLVADLPGPGATCLQGGVQLLP